MITRTVTCTQRVAMSFGLKKAGTSASSKCISQLSPAFVRNTRPSPSPLQLRFVSQHTVISPRPTNPTTSRSILVSRCEPSRTRSLATSSSSATATPAHQTPTPSSAAPAPDTLLTWSAYLPLRRKRHRYNTISSLITGFATFAGGLSFLATQDLEKISGVVFGLDPFIAMGACGLAFAMVGWLVGPFAGDAIFRLVYRRFTGQMAIKEKDLFHRIQKYRCDPSSTSVNNPVPDYYGEKISSVQVYRQWLRDQRNFGKKRATLKMV